MTNFDVASPSSTATSRPDTTVDNSTLVSARGIVYCQMLAQRGGWMPGEVKVGGRDGVGRRERGFRDRRRPATGPPPA